MYKARWQADKGGGLFVSSPFAEILGKAALQADAEVYFTTLERIGPEQVRSENHETPLMAAVVGGDVSIIENCILRGVALEAQDGFSRRAIHWAAEGYKFRSLKRLLAAGADLKARTGTQETAVGVLLREATSDTDSMASGIVRLLLAGGYDPCDYENGVTRETALHLACKKMLVQTADALLDGGAKARQKTRAGQTALDFFRGGLDSQKAVVVNPEGVEALGLRLSASYS